MSRISSSRYGRLVYAGSMGDRDMVVAGDVWHLDFSVRSDRSAYGSNTVRVDAELIQPSMTWETGNTNGAAGDALWNLVKNWPDPKQGRTLPPDVEALFTLAKRHQAEYDELREALAVLRALGG